MIKNMKSITLWKKSFFWYSSECQNLKGSIVQFSSKAITLLWRYNTLLELSDYKRIHFGSSSVLVAFFRNIFCQFGLHSKDNRLEQLLIFQETLSEFSLWNEMLAKISDPILPDVVPSRLNLLRMSKCVNEWIPLGRSQSAHLK